MFLKLYKLKVWVKKKLENLAHQMLKPLSYFFTEEKMDARYKKKQNKITEEKALKWIVEDIVRYIIKHNSEIDILICDHAN